MKATSAIIATWLTIVRDRRQDLITKKMTLRTGEGARPDVRLRRSLCFAVVHGRHVRRGHVYRSLTDCLKLPSARSR
jgi:hypothetical protein